MALGGFEPWKQLHVPAFKTGPGLKAVQQLREQADVIGNVDLADGYAVDVRTQHGGQIVLAPDRVQGVDPRNHRDAGGRELRQQGGDGVARVRLFGVRHGVLHVRDQRVRAQVQRLAEHRLLVAGNEEQASEMHVTWRKNDFSIMRTK